MKWEGKRRINKLEKMIMEFLEAKPSENDYQFFDELEFFAFENYEAFAKENEKVARKIDDDIIELCSWVEHMEDCTEHRKKLEQVYEELKKLIN